MSRRSIATDDAPAAIGPYSQAVVASGRFCLAGQILLEPRSMALVEGDIEADVRQVFANLAAVAKVAGATLALP